MESRSYGCRPQAGTRLDLRHAGESDLVDRRGVRPCECQFDVRAAVPDVYDAHVHDDRHQYRIDLRLENVAMDRADQPDSQPARADRRTPGQLPARRARVRGESVRRTGLGTAVPGDVAVPEKVIAAAAPRSR